MGKKTVISKNYLEQVPTKAPTLSWRLENNGLVTLEIANTGWANWIAQKLFRRPKVSFVHLDEMGSFVWPLIDGTKTIGQMGPLVEEKFGKDDQLYPRLARYFQILHSYRFVVLEPPAANKGK